MYRVGQKKCVLGCVISPLRQQVESHNLGHTFLANSVLFHHLNENQGLKRSHPKLCGGADFQRLLSQATKQLAGSIPPILGQEQSSFFGSVTN